MSVDEFMCIARMLSRSTWTRFYLFWNGRSEQQPMVLEIADHSTETYNQLSKELAEKGFKRMPTEFCKGWKLHRWMVPRDEQENAREVSMVVSR